MRSTVLLVALCSACYSPAYKDCEISCASTQVCPSGYVCKADLCVADLATSCNGRDAAIDAAPGAMWGTPTAVKFVAGTPPGLDDDPTLRDDMLELYTSRTVNGQGDLFVSHRANLTASWDSPSAVTALNSAVDEDTPELSSDGLTIYFASKRGGGAGGYDIYTASRASLSGAFGTPSLVTGVNSATDDISPTVSRDGLTMVFASLRNASAQIDFHLYIATRASTTAAWGTPQTMTMLNAPPSLDESPMLSADKLTIYYDSNRNGDADLFRATRPGVADPFGAPTRIDELYATPEHETDPWVSSDGKHMFFIRTVGGTPTLMETSR